jgi:hypothetical protein
VKRALFFCLLFACCAKRTSEPLQASGKLNTISVIIDDALWNGEIGDSLRNKFASPVLGLPQEEPQFTINQYPAKLLEGFMTDSRNIIVIKKGVRPDFRIVSDEYAKPQHVYHISGMTAPEILDVLQKHATEMIAMMRQTEIAEAQRRIDTAKISDAPLRAKFRIALDIPAGYRYALQGNGFTWLKKDIVSGNMSVLVYAVPLKCLERNHDAIRNIMNMRDSIGSCYIHGTVPGSSMITEPAYAPYLEHAMFAGHKTLVTRGTWELQHDYMAGPFVNYAISDKANRRILVLEGFCYAPSKDKRDLMLELEAIIRSVRFFKPAIPTR